FRRANVSSAAISRTVPPRSFALAIAMRPRPTIQDVAARRPRTQIVAEVHQSFIAYGGCHLLIGGVSAFCNRNCFIQLLVAGNVHPSLWRLAGDDRTALSVSSASRALISTLVRV